MKPKINKTIKTPIGRTLLSENTVNSLLKPNTFQVARVALRSAIEHELYLEKRNRSLIDNGINVECRMMSVFHHCLLWNSQCLLNVKT